MLNKSKGDMYLWVTHTWNPIAGRCPHACSYCYMKRFPLPAMHLNEKSLKDNLGSDRTIFVGSSCDMWAEAVDGYWITQVLWHCKKFPNNTYVFQTKNPQRLYERFLHALPDSCLIGTTLETNRHIPAVMAKAPPPADRMTWMARIRNTEGIFISIEPILDFDLERLVDFVKDCGPQFVSIGADSKGHNLPEPSPDKVKAFG